MRGFQQTRKPEGIALVQVLVIVAILMVMGVSFINETRDNIQIATWNNDRLAAQVANKDMESALLYELITIDRSVDGVPSVQVRSRSGGIFGAIISTPVKLRELQFKISHRYCMSIILSRSISLNWLLDWDIAPMRQQDC